MGDKTIKFHYIFLALLLVFGTIKTYYAYHKDYKFPYHHDEWQHIGISKYINEQHYNKQYNPYLDEPRGHKDLESGFHLFLASLSEFFQIDLIFLYQYLAAIFFLISALALYMSISSITKNRITGIISVVVFTFLKTNVNVLGKDFFVPFSMTLPFIFIYIMYFSEFIKQNKKSYLYIMLTFLLFLIFIYPPSFIMMIVPSVFFGLINYKAFKDKKLFLLLVPLSLILLYFFWRDNIFSTVRYIFEILYFEPGWGKLEIKYSIPLFYGLINTFLALYGFYLAYKKKQLNFYFIFSFFSLVLTAVFNLFDFSILVPYNRALHYSIIAMVPLTAIGFSDLAERYLKKKYLIYASILVFFIVLSFSKYSLDETYKVYGNPVITEEAYSGMIWLKENYGSGNILVTPYFMTSAVYPISENQVISLIPSQLEGGLIQDNLNFYNYDCDMKQDIILRSNANFVLSYSKIDCSYLNEQFNKNFYIYSLQ